MEQPHLGVHAGHAAKRLLTVKEVARRLRLKPATVQKRIRDAAIPAIKEGRSYLIDDADLQAYLEKKRS